jgi:hypothetical protein
VIWYLLVVFKAIHWKKQAEGSVLIDLTDGNWNHQMEMDNRWYIIRVHDTDDGWNWEHIGNYRNTSPIIGHVRDT